MKLRHLLPLALVLFAASACANDDKASETARAAMQSLAPQAKVDTVEAAPLPGYRQVIVGSKMVYVSDDGKYLLEGTLYDVQSTRDRVRHGLAVERLQTWLLTMLGALGMALAAVASTASSRTRSGGARARWVCGSR